VARTVLVEIAGSSMAVQTWTDRLLRRWQRHLDSPSSDWQPLTVKQAPDGVWYLQAGLYGPALAVTNRWIVISHSPAAVRQNVAHLESRSGAAPATTAGQPGNSPSPP
jgi:hypothetical protein